MKKATANGIIKLKKDTIADLSESITNQDIEKIELTIRILQNNTIKLNLLEALNTALLIAFGHRQSKMIEYLISRGAEINVKEDGITSTPIFKAAEKVDLSWFKEIFSDLSQKNKLALLNSRNENEETPLFLIVNEDKISHEKRADLINFFIANGADLNIVNRQHKVLRDKLKEKFPGLIPELNLQNSEESEAIEKAVLVEIDPKKENNSHSAVTPMGQTEVNDIEELMFYLEQ